MIKIGVDITELRLSQKARCFDRFERDVAYVSKRGVSTPRESGIILLSYASLLVMGTLAFCERTAIWKKEIHVVTF